MNIMEEESFTSKEAASDTAATLLVDRRLVRILEVDGVLDFSPMSKLVRLQSFEISANGFSLRIFVFSETGAKFSQADTSSRF